MILPYSTDAPIYHFPWMTIALIVANCLTFAFTGMGYNDEGWLLQFGNGLHPLEWVAFNFLHFGIAHLLGNMFFLWAFGIVVEGKLGWWKFLGIYLTIGIVGGFLIQLTMLGYKPALNFGELGDLSPQKTSRPWSWLEPTPAFAQDDDGADEPEMMDMPVGNFPVGQAGEMDSDDDGISLDPDAMKKIGHQLARLARPGMGGATLVVFALLGIVLVWAPKNEIMCLWIGLNAGTFEMEYIYFCGFKIGSEILGAMLLTPGFEITSEIANALGAVMGFGVGAAFVKLSWVDCENWDLFAYAQNKHGSTEHVGSWQDAAAISIRRDKTIVAPVHDDEDDEPRIRSGKKKRVLPKLQEMSSLDDDFPDEEPIEVWEDLDETEEAPPEKSANRKRSTSAMSPSKPMQSEASPKAARSLSPLPPIPVNVASPKLPNVAGQGAPVAKEEVSPLDRIRTALAANQPNAALAELRRQRSTDPTFQLPKNELRGMADSYFKAQNVRDSKPFLEEFIERFADEADRQRVKLAVLLVKFLKRPTAALKLLAKVDRFQLPDEYRPIYEQAARQAQQMIADGMTDAT